jgi:probable chromosome-partitioning protein parB
LTEHLGVNAEVKTSNQKKGKIVLHFDTPETFEYLLKQLGINQAF